ncbi:hypothetical protein [Streptomyces sp. G45]|uniref:hypothetical protein n=1 Tax=Streptomyces sp. G45 TaxID=3406627 RepID=UPI003C253B56
MTTTPRPTPAGRATTTWTLLRKGATHPLTRLATAALLQALATHLSRTTTPGPHPPGRPTAYHQSRRLKTKYRLTHTTPISPIVHGAPNAQLGSGIQPMLMW